MLLDRERLRPAVLDRVAQPVQRADAGIAAPGEHQLVGAAHADQLVVDQVRRHADQRQVLAALADDLVPGRERDEMGEAFHGDGVAVPDGRFHGFGEGQKTGHSGASKNDRRFIYEAASRGSNAQTSPLAAMSVMSLISSEPIFHIHAELADIRHFGKTPYGERRVIDIIGGRVDGPEAHGPHPAPAPTGRSSARTEPPTSRRATASRPTPAPASWSGATGCATARPTSWRALARGEAVDPGRYYFRTVMRFEAADPAVVLAQPDHRDRPRRAREERRAPRRVRGAVTGNLRFLRSGFTRDRPRLRPSRLKPSGGNR